MISNYIETCFVALPRPPTNLRVESAQHNMIKVDEDDDADDDTYDDADDNTYDDADMTMMIILR